MDWDLEPGEGAAIITIVVVTILSVLFFNHVPKHLVKYENSPEKSIHAEVVDKYSHKVPVDDEVVKKRKVVVEIDNREFDVTVPFVVYEDVEIGDEIPVTTYNVRGKVVRVTYDKSDKGKLDFGKHKHDSHKGDCDCDCYDDYYYDYDDDCYYDYDDYDDDTDDDEEEDAEDTDSDSDEEDLADDEDVDADDTNDDTDEDEDADITDADDEDADLENDDADLDDSDDDDEDDDDKNSKSDKSDKNSKKSKVA